MNRSLCLAAVLLSLGCGASPAVNDGVVWIDGESFTAPKQSFFEGLAASFGGGEADAARLAAALDHNCPLEEVVVAGASTDDATSFVVRVCGEEKRYAFDGSIYFERITVKLATVAAPTQAPDAAATPAAPDSAAPAPEPTPPTGDRPKR